MQGRAASEKELNSIASPENMLCTTLEDNKTLPRRTVVLDFDADPDYWHDIIDNDIEGLNIWHFHAQMFPIWLMIRLADVSTVYLSQYSDEFNNETAKHVDKWFPSTLLPDVDVILRFPDEGFHRFGSNESFLVTSQKLRELNENDNSILTSLTGLQAISDAFKGKVMATSHSTSSEELFRVMKESQMEPRASVWLQPPSRDGFMWNLERYKLSDASHQMRNLSSCSTDILKDYLSNYIPSVSSLYPTKIAKHMCLVSMPVSEKQDNERSGKIDVRNLSPSMFAEVIKRLSSPVILSPQFDLRSVEGEQDGFPYHLERSSLSGQMRLVHEECAVLVGVHSAGLALGMALRPGAHLMEMYSDKEYWTFRNSVGLIDNVSYTAFNMTSDGDEGVEFNLEETGEHLGKFIDFVFEQYDLSLTRQEEIAQSL